MPWEITTAHSQLKGENGKIKYYKYKIHLQKSSQPEKLLIKMINCI